MSYGGDVPPYSNEQGDSQYPNDKKPLPQKIDVTLYHSDLLGMLSGTPIHLLFPSDLTLLRFWTTPQALAGIETFSASGAADLFGSRSMHGQPYDLPMFGDRIKNVYIRSGHWIDAICVATHNGISTPWIGGAGGSETKFKGIIVGVVGEQNNGMVGKFGVITTNESDGYREFRRQLEQTKAQGIDDASSGAPGPSGPKKT